MPLPIIPKNQINGRVPSSLKRAWKREYQRLEESPEYRCFDDNLKMEQMLGVVAMHWLDMGDGVRRAILAEYLPRLEAMAYRDADADGIKYDPPGPGFITRMEKAGIALPGEPTRPVPIETPPARKLSGRGVADQPKPIETPAGRGGNSRKRGAG